MKINNGKYKLCIIGTFPPPVHGLSLINKAMKDEFIKVGIKPLVLDISSKSLNRSFFNIYFRFLKTLLTIFKFTFYITVNRIEYIYIGLSGGLGQIYDLFFITVGTLFNSKIFIHHHSFAYLNKISLLTKLIVNISKNSAVHIVLCETMRKKLFQYNKNINIEILSNAVFLKSSDIQKFDNNGKFMTIGFLSNISFEKGIIEYFEVLRKLIKDGYQVKGIIAGSITNLKSKKYLEANLEELKEIHYIGKIGTKEKEDFLNNIDLLLMPTRYSSEAEPLVIHEAMSHGVAVIAWNRGCISNIIPKNTGVVIENDKQYISHALNQIIFWIKNPEKLILIRKLSLKQFNHQKAKYLTQLNKIVGNIIVNNYVSSS